MMRLRFYAFIAGSLLGLAPAFANVPVNDAAILNRHAETSSTTTQLKSVVLDQKQKRAGIKCAVTKGAKGQVQNPGSVPNPTTGSNAVQRYAPDLPTAPQQGATGGSLNEQTLSAETGKVISGVEATQGTITATSEAYRTRASEVGSSETVMAALDQNSAIRVQNGMSWNQAIATANLLVQALNAMNLTNQSDTSQAAIVLTGPTHPQPPTTPGGICPQGYLGMGTPADPCRPSVCSTTPMGTTPDPGCVTRRFIDSDGNVSVFLDLASRLYVRDSAAAAAAQRTQAITNVELQHALATARKLATGTR